LRPPFAQGPGGLTSVESAVTPFCRRIWTRRRTCSCSAV
jgi:hypothetical protein